MTLMLVSQPAGALVAGGLLTNAGAPSNGTNEVQTLTIGGTPTAGTFTITFDGWTTGAIAWSATNATLLANILAALDALPNVDANGLVPTAGTLTAGIGTVLLTAGANLAKSNIPLATADGTLLTGTSPTVAIATTTPGVNATQRGAGPGALLIDTTNSVLYINTGTAYAPVWGKYTPTTAQTSPGAIGTTTNLTAVPGSFADAAAVQTFLAGANAWPRIESRLDVIEAKVDAVIAALVTAGVFA